MLLMMMMIVGRMREKYSRSRRIVYSFKYLKWFISVDDQQVCVTKSFSLPFPQNFRIIFPLIRNVDLWDFLLSFRMRSTVCVLRQRSEEKYDDDDGTGWRHFWVTSSFEAGFLQTKLLSKDRKRMIMKRSDGLLRMSWDVRKREGRCEERIPSCLKIRQDREEDLRAHDGQESAWISRRISLETEERSISWKRGSDENWLLLNCYLLFFCGSVKSHCEIFYRREWDEVQEWRRTAKERRKNVLRQQKDEERIEWGGISCEEQERQGWCWWWGWESSSTWWWREDKTRDNDWEKSEWAQDRIA